MANLKNITDVPVVESAEGLNLIANDNGVAKQIPASVVGTQADWAEMDETSPAFIKNKPVEELDLDITVNMASDSEGNSIFEPIVNFGTFNVIKNRVLNNEHSKINVNIAFANPEDASVAIRENCIINSVVYAPSGTFNPESEMIGFIYWSIIADRMLITILLPDNTIITEDY